MVIDNKKVVDLPINTRNPIMLAALSNGITPTSGTTLDQKPFSNSADGSWSINGGVGSTVEFLLDGAPNNTIYNGVTHGGECAVGGCGAGIQGHDQHVRCAVRAHRRRRDQHFAEERHERPARLGIRISEARAVQRGGVFGQRAWQSPTPASGLDQYGFTIGGPVRVPKVYNGKDKTFFFFALEQYHEDQEYPGEKVASVPTAAQRSGRFLRHARQLRPPDHDLRSAHRHAPTHRQMDPHAVSRATSSPPTGSIRWREDSGAVSAAEHAFGGIAGMAEQLLSGRTTSRISTSRT